MTEIEIITSCSSCDTDFDSSDDTETCKFCDQEFCEDCKSDHANDIVFDENNTEIKTHIELQIKEFQLSQKKKGKKKK